MSVDECTRKIIKAVANRKREVVMTFQAKFGLWAKITFAGIR